MKSTVATVMLACTLGTTAVAAQVPSPTAPSSSWSTIRVAKWVVLGAAVGFGGFALANSARADDAYGKLNALCHAEPSRCSIREGSYADAQAERLYDEAVRGDRNAQIGIIGGQITLLGSASLFIYDLRNGRGPSDIPYPSPAGSHAFVARRLLVGASLTF
ncbi:MAG: hypothetical protein ABR543_12740 [Gemmatimonadaceae bacterium]